VMNFYGTLFEAAQGVITHDRSQTDRCLERIPNWSSFSSVETKRG
jgi:hypothetical protein